jgi:hypothetical protein
MKRFHESRFEKEYVRMSRISSVVVLVVLAGVLASGCGPKAGRSPDASPASQSSSPRAEYLLKAEPAGAEGVKAVRAKAKDNDEVTVVGRVGGDAKPWVEGMAAFVIVDPEMKPCDANEGCATPWDYCCDLDLLPKVKALVKIVDSQGRAVPTDARKLLGIKELQTVVAHGRAQRDEAGNLTVLADGVFLRQ